LVIDLAEMRRVVVSPQTQAASVDGGATAGDVVTAARPHGLTPRPAPPAGWVWRA
jgi:FAD/FMN-containing dehydrogenase